VHAAFTVVERARNLMTASWGQNDWGGPIMTDVGHFHSDAARWQPASSKPARPTERASGSVGSIVINAILIYAAQHALDWQLGWITPAWSDVLGPVQLMLEASIVANLLMLVIDDGWFRNLAGAITTGLAVVAL
jgi:hypothetical protein